MRRGAWGGTGVHMLRNHTINFQCVIFFDSGSTAIPVHKKRTPVGVFSLGPLKPLFYIDLIPCLGYHFTLFAQYAADIFPLAILVACRAWKDLRRAA